MKWRARAVSPRSQFEGVKQSAAAAHPPFLETRTFRLCKWHIIASERALAMRKSGAHMWFIAAAHPSVVQTVTADRAHIVIAACLRAARPPIKIVTQIL